MAFITRMFPKWIRLGRYFLLLFICLVIMCAGYIALTALYLRSNGSFASLSLVRRMAVFKETRVDTGLIASRCSLSSGFRVYFYTAQELAGTSPQLSDSWSWKLYGTWDAQSACVFVLVLGAHGRVSADQVQAVLPSLPHWGKGSHVVVNFAQTEDNESVVVSPTADTGSVVLAQPSFAGSHFRHNHDIVIPQWPGLANQEADWSQLPPLFPARRKYLVSFWGELVHPAEEGRGWRNRIAPSSLLQVIQKAATALAESEVQARVLLSCGESPKAQGPPEAVWAACGKPEDRRQLLSQSTFALLPVPVTSRMLSEALQQGAVPVVLGGGEGQGEGDAGLPFSQLLQWWRAVLFLPLHRAQDLPHVLSTVPDSRLLEWRRQGRWLWQTYLSSQTSILDSTLTLLRARLMMPKAPAPDVPTLSLVNAEDSNNKNASSAQGSTRSQTEGQVPAVSRVPSPRYQSQLSWADEVRAWNTPGDTPFFLMPSTPFEPVPPSDAKFKDGGTAGRTPGDVFSSQLGGNIPQEMFTAVMMTYKRTRSLMESLGRLRGTPFLHQVIVVWNDPDPPSPSLIWPRLGVPVLVTRGQGNNLNNRFLPYDAIETDCILSIDDDVVLSHDQLLLGFRVWRTERERIVGYITRFHRWTDKRAQWFYSDGAVPNEMSLALTGAAFFHRYYLYLYTYVMPKAILDHVANNTNCEDIAMDFLIAHVTRKPPIRMEGVLKFKCPGCPMSLSAKKTHMNNRHKCMRLFADVYGYMPLLFTPNSVAPLPPYS